MPILWKKNFLDAMANYDGSKCATWYVVDRKPVEVGGKGVVPTYESDPFFCFHTINSYEEPSPTDPTKVDIIADLCAYENLDVLKRFYLERLMSDSPNARPYADPANKSTQAILRRFRLPHLPSTPTAKPLKAEILFSEKPGVAPELPGMNSSRRAKKHRFVYGVTATGKSSFFDGLIKYDMDPRTTQTWSVFGQTAGEPIFVAVPNSTSADEDAGVLLTVVLDGTKGKSYLLILNAKNMEEVARANVDGVVGFGFHGFHVANASKSSL